jgi:hypothetical protein
LRRQASAFQLRASRLTGDQAWDFPERAREAIAIASRIDAAVAAADTPHASCRAAAA